MPVHVAKYSLVLGQPLLGLLWEYPGDDLGFYFFGFTRTSSIRCRGIVPLILQASRGVCLFFTHRHI